MCEKEKMILSARKSLATKVMVNSQIISETPEEQLRFISIDWLKAFLTRENCGPIDNRPIICEHGKLNLQVSELGKCITADSWTELQKQFGGGPELSMFDVCTECMKIYCHKKADELDSEGKRKAVVDYIKKTSSGRKGVNPEEGFWISSDWLKCWSENNEVGDFADMTRLISCPHGNLTPDEKCRKLIHVSAWSYISSLAKQPVTEFAGTTKPCTICQEEMDANKQIAEMFKKEKKAEKDKFSSLLKDPHPLEYTNYYLIDRVWYDMWKKWLNDSSQTDLPPFDSSVLLCQHKKIAYNPSDYLSKSSQVPISFVPVPESMWSDLVEKHGKKPKPTEIMFKLLKKSEPEFSVEVCYDCLFSQQEAESAERQNFASGKLTVCRLPGKFADKDAVLAAFTNAKENPPTTGGTKSRPKRAEPKNVTKTVEGVDSSWTVQGLKMHLFANYDGSLDCGMPEEQVLIIDGEILDDDKILSDYHVEKEKTVITLGVLKEAAQIEKESSSQDLAPEPVGFAGSRLVTTPLRSSTEFPAQPSATTQ